MGLAPARRCGDARRSWWRMVMRWLLGRPFHQPLLHEFLEVVVERAGTEFVLALVLAGDLLHDAVAVAVFAGEGEQDMERRRGQRKKRSVILDHLLSVI